MEFTPTCRGPPPLACPAYPAAAGGDGSSRLYPAEGVGNGGIASEKPLWSLAIFLPCSKVKREEIAPEKHRQIKNGS
ncbi:hypothetical protein KJ688_15960 [bacterium]|nr:hypothetical protein [bacterium]